MAFASNCHIYFVSPHALEEHNKTCFTCIASINSQQLRSAAVANVDAEMPDNGKRIGQVREPRDMNIFVNLKVKSNQSASRYFELLYL